MKETGALQEASSLTTGAATPIPAWLDAGTQAGRQAGVHERLEEVHARLQAGVSNLEQQTQAKDVNG